MTTRSIFTSFPISDEEYLELDKKFGNLCNFAACQLRRKNSRNNHGHDLDDFIQQLKMALVRAASYHKRQVYINACLTTVKQYANDDFTKTLLHELDSLWNNRTRHGASRQKFGDHQEALLEQILCQSVPRHKRPKKNCPLQIDHTFTTYCKAITWNEEKSIGRKITRERVIRTGLVSLSEFDYLGADKAGNRPMVVLAE